MGRWETNKETTRENKNTRRTSQDRWPDRGRMKISGYIYAQISPHPCSGPSTNLRAETAPLRPKSTTPTERDAQANPFPASSTRLQPSAESRKMAKSAHLTANVAPDTPRTKSGTRPGDWPRAAHTADRTIRPIVQPALSSSRTGLPASPPLQVGVHCPRTDARGPQTQADRRRRYVGPYYSLSGRAVGGAAHY